MTTINPIPNLELKRYGNVFGQIIWKDNNLYKINFIYKGNILIEIFHYEEIINREDISFINGEYIISKN